MKRELILRETRIMVLTAVFLMAFVTTAFAMGKKEGKTAIVLAQFGTSYPSALVAITNIQKQVQDAFPGVKVKLAFTSYIIRNIWHKRHNDKKFLEENKDIPRDVLRVKGPLATMADLQDEGYTTIIVQPTHVFEGEEYLDLKSCVDGLDSIAAIRTKHKPFKKIVLGRPLFGEKGVEYLYHEDLRIAAKAVKADVSLAAKNKAALVYMGHGNKCLSTGAYIEFQETLRTMHPETPVYVGVVEGFPSLDYVVSGLIKDRIRKVVLKPLMIVAGDHAANDMAGDEDDSWKMTFNSKGIEVTPVLQGMGENSHIANIFIQHIKDVARDNQIRL
ncbi:MAG: sirohydrochlorin cobaltochelatase [Desulfobacterales bacterium]|nr:sirohydrochlorin cobaltochelatase [Desulfobacterales bacterium]